MHDDAMDETDNDLSDLFILQLQPHQPIGHQFHCCYLQRIKPTLISVVQVTATVSGILSKSTNIDYIDLELPIFQSFRAFMTRLIPDSYASWCSRDNSSAIIVCTHLCTSEKGEVAIKSPIWGLCTFTVVLSRRLHLLSPSSPFRCFGCRWRLCIAIFGQKIWN